MAITTASPVTPKPQYIRRKSTEKVVSSPIHLHSVVKSTTIPKPPPNGGVLYFPPKREHKPTSGVPAGSASLPYTASPLYLLISDVSIFLRNLAHLPYILLPLLESSPDAPSLWGQDELSGTVPNIFAVVVHTFLFISQALFLLSLIYIIVWLPIWMGVAYIAAFVISNFIFCTITLNGFKALQNKVFVSLNGKEFDGEKWVFINGVAVGSHWMQNNLERLAKTFGRKVVGVHNPSFGIIFDVIECLMQRCFCYYTQDVRTGFAYVKHLLTDQSVKKVILVMHSQGGLEGSLILDMLLAELGPVPMAKIEVFTFGCAANHFNSPGTATSEHGSQQQDNKYAVKYVEHYANDSEFVARWGVLSFAGLPMNRYAGAIFERSAEGHLLNQHYLGHMFELEQKPVDGVLTCQVKDGNKFMDAVVQVRDARSQNSYATNNRVVKVKELSRLWLYRNGLTPKDEEAETTD